MENILTYLADKYHGCIKYWWLALALGILLFIIGALIFIFPLISYLTMSVLFGIIILISGIFYIIMSSSKSLKGRGWLMASGIIEVILGIILTIWPSLTAASLPYFLGFWLLFKGFTLIGIGSDMSDVKGSGWGWSIVWALVLIICAFIIILHPIIFGIEAVIIWIGVSCLVGGLSLMSFASSLKKMVKNKAS